MPLPSWMMPFGRERGDIPKATGVEVACPKCKHRRMDEIFSRNVSRSSDDRTGYECPACHYSTLNQPTPEPSKITILPLADTHGRYATEKPKPAPDETRSHDKKPFFEKIFFKSDSERKPLYTKLTRNGKTQYVGYCQTCDKQRTSFSPHCPHCKEVLE